MARFDLQGVVFKPLFPAFLEPSGLSDQLFFTLARLAIGFLLTDFRLICTSVFQPLFSS